MQFLPTVNPLARPELTPVAIKAGITLADRLFGKSKKIMDYTFIPTTFFTSPYEYGCIGFTQEMANQKYGEDKVETYLSRFGFVEAMATHRVDHDGQDFSAPCFVKLICLKEEKNRVIGFHIISENAGEITQGYSLPLK